MKKEMTLALMMLAGLSMQIRAERPLPPGLRRLGQTGDEQAKETAVADANAQEEALKRLAETAADEFGKKYEIWLARKAIVEKLEDQAVLSDIAKNDKDMHIRIVAIRKLNSQTLLAEIARSGENIQARMAAAEGVTSQTLLAEIARSDEPRLKLAREATVAGLVSDEDIVRQITIFKLTDQITLAEIAKDDKSEVIRKAAVGRLTDQVALLKIAKSENNSDVRLAAVGRIVDQAVLRDIAENNEDTNMRAAAVGRLDNHALLAEYAKNDKVEKVRLVAAQKLNDTEILVAIAKSSKNEWICIGALEYLVRQTDGEDTWRELPHLFGLIIDPSASIAHIARTHKNEYMRLAAMYYLVSCPSNQESLFAELAKNDASEWVRKVATEQLDRMKAKE